MGMTKTQHRNGLHADNYKPDALARTAFRASTPHEVFFPQSSHRSSSHCERQMHTPCLVQFPARRVRSSLPEGQNTAPEQNWLHGCYSTETVLDGDLSNEVLVMDGGYWNCYCCCCRRGGREHSSCRTLSSCRCSVPSLNWLRPIPFLPQRLLYPRDLPL